MILSIDKPCLYDAHRSATVTFRRWSAYFSFIVELTTDECGGLFSCNYMSSRTILILFRHKCVFLYKMHTGHLLEFIVHSEKI